MPPITEQEQLQILQRQMADMSLKLDMLINALRGNTDIDPKDTGLTGKVRWLTSEVLNMKRQNERVRGMFTGGVAVGSVAGGVVAFLVTFLINHFIK